MRLVLVDDHPVVQSGLAQVLAALPDMDVVAVAGNAREALDQVEALQPDIVLLDLGLPDINGVELTRRLKEGHNLRVVIFSMQDSAVVVQRALRAGADAYVLKGAPIREVTTAIRRVNEGEHFISPQIQDVVLLNLLKNGDVPEDEKNYETLTDREQQVLRLLVEGHSTARIGKVLYISPKTVESHRANIMRKLGTETLVDLIRYAMRISIIDPEEWQG